MRLPGRNAIRPANSTASRPCSVQIRFRRAHERPPPQQRQPGNLKSCKRTPAYCDPATLGTPTGVPNFSATSERNFDDRNPFPGAPRRRSRRTESEQLPYQPVGRIRSHPGRSFVGLAIALGRYRTAANFFNARAEHATNRRDNPCRLTSHAPIRGKAGAFTNR